MGGIDQIQRDWSLLRQAPFSLALVVLAIAGAAWLMAAWLFRHQLASLQSRIDLKDDVIVDFQRKLGVVTPGEARARVEALESRLRDLEPQRLSEAQRASIVTAAQRTPGTILIPSVGTNPRRAELAADLRRAFSDGGWTVKSISLFTGIRAPSGVLVYLNRTTQEGACKSDTVLKALGLAGIACDTIMATPDAGYDAQIVLTGEPS